MKFLVSVTILSLTVALHPSSRAQDLSPNAPPDRPASASLEQVQKLEEAIAPYVKKAKESLPRAKKKYLKGLRKGEVFFVTTRIHEGGKFEQVFVKVTSWDGETIRGLLASDMNLLTDHKRGEQVTCKEGDVIDWTISKPDGTEEGNFVGKFLDSYKP